MSTQKLATSLLSLAAVFAVTSQASAVPTPMIHIDTPGDCDPLFIPDDVHEIGDMIEFPTDESLFSTDQGPTSLAPCPLQDDPSVLNRVVEIRNTSGIDWHEVWYVADEETTITNYDGEANHGIPGLAPAHEAFRLDHKVSDPAGSHHPLIFESMTFDGIWAAGEVWRFILQDYSNTLGLPANAISSIGVGSVSSTPATGIIDSSGSIIAVTATIPEPLSGTLLLFGFVGLGVTVRRR
ncbi:PEP-CTERM sorting domain-containing protein [Adhaeretor mobilis]|uniref:PEP-CTERM protein-sorting domain-containing protein n=1 Tax=Adhaeretor mobilis TaxID=1930276 RepID=A0A517MT64_9BACT|nr:PEP-CTERM sorting domain-containing protein [Adhaeretor mobilis]QDS98069.1 hypothetical protein HG15A2_13410 [Adhaeretor mobilis]